jgi:hypothetical protein
MEPLFRTSCTQPFLVARFAARQRILGWSLNHPGFAEGEVVAWLEVRDADLPMASIRSRCWSGSWPRQGSPARSA